MFMIISVLCILLNVVHMIILSDLRELRGEPYLLLLQHINVTGIALSLMYSVVNLCAVKTALLSSSLAYWIVVTISLISNQHQSMMLVY